MIYRTADPLRLAEMLWPSVTFYDRQKEIIRSAWDNDRTIVPAGHVLGKSFVAAATILLFFLTRHPCRVVTTSVDQAQLEGVLWGEIRRFIQQSECPLSHDRGGPLLVNHLHLRRAHGGELCGVSYCIGRVAAKGEGMSGHHVARADDGIPRTMFFADEASGVDQQAIDKASEWAHRIVLAGNPYECDNEFKWSVKGFPGTDDRGGDVPRENGQGFRRRVLKVQAVHSPNVRYALAQQRAGLRPSGEMIIPGVLSWGDYCDRRAHWPPPKQCVGLDAEWYEGAENLLFPPQWLAHSERLAESLRGRERQAVAIGVDPGEGVASTSFAAVDRLGLIELSSVVTPDTSVVPGLTLAFMRKHGVTAERVVFDRGGGGKHHADRLRSMGHAVRTVAFGEPVQPDPRRGRTGPGRRMNERETRTTYFNRRAALYGEMRELLDPSGPNGGFALPACYTELRRQLAPIPLSYDDEGRLYLLPKNRKDPKSKRPTLTQLIGRSPDDADALVCATFGMLHQEHRAVAGVL